MALRVLLADESTTIKKVMQLALQDFAVEVKAVHAGVDVVEVARAFQPDIIFADVLLQKKNGYEVCADLKADAQLRDVPVVLMWSSFMDLDETLADGCGANRRLEKPFDVEHLRQVLLELVPKTHTQRLAHFLKFPASFSEPLKQEEELKQRAQPPAKPKLPQQPTRQPLAMPTSTLTSTRTSTSTGANITAAAPSAGPAPQSWNMDSFEDISDLASDSASDSANDLASDLASDLGQSAETDGDDEDFSEFRLQSTAKIQQTVSPPDREIPSVEESDDPWSHQDLSRFKLELPPVTASNPEYDIDLELPDSSMVELEQNRPQAFRQGTDVTSSKAEYLRERSHIDNNLILDGEEIETAEHELDLALEGDSGFKLTSMDDEPEHDESETFRIPRDTLPTQGFSSRHGDETVSRGPNRAADVGIGSGLTPEELERIVRAQTRETIEAMVRKIVPDLATDIIREELQRLLEDTSVRDPSRENRR